VALVVFAGRDLSQSCSSYSDTLESFAELVRQTTETANEFGDFVSAEMFNEISAGVDKWRRTLAAS
jgi:DNA-binding ferritin-like protein